MMPAAAMKADGSNCVYSGDWISTVLKLDWRISVRGVTMVTLLILINLATIDRIDGIVKGGFISFLASSWRDRKLLSPLLREGGQLQNVTGWNLLIAGNRQFVLKTRRLQQTQ
jgi:hypothetical protein